MHADEKDREQIDSLVRNLMTTRRPLSPPAKPQTATAPGEPQLAAQPVAEQRSVGRWSSDDLQIPVRRQERREKRFALPFTLPKISLPALPAMRAMPALADLGRFIKAPSQATIVRMWVGLGVLQASAMLYWPYQKTYWGLMIYLLCLGVSLVNGIWGARLSWDLRLGAAHTVSIGTVFWAVSLAATEAVRVA